MIKQLRINNQSSYDDYDVYISRRTIGLPSKKVIKEVLPYSNLIYDFSNANGEVYYDERLISYEFDIAENSAEEMEETKAKLLNWLMNVHDTDIYDDYLAGWHFHGSFESSSWTEDFEGATLIVDFKVYPYQIANEMTTHEHILTTTLNNATFIVTNNSSHRVFANVIVNGSVVITYNSLTIAIKDGEYNKMLLLEPGDNSLLIETVEGCEVIIQVREERF